MVHIQRLRLVSLALVVVVGVLCPWSATARAQSDADRAAAQALFDEAQELKEADDWEGACKKFEGSRALDPALGTQLNLADCYEHIGRTASAWVNFVEVAQADDDKRRAGFAKKRADDLKPRLTKLQINVEEPVDGMVIKRGDVEVAKPTWGTLVPVDPGSYEITATAPGKHPFRRTIEVEGEGEAVEIEVPALADDLSDSGDDDDDSGDVATPDPGEGGGSGQLIAGGVVTGLGAVGLVVGVAFTVIAHGKYDESKDECLTDEPNRCYAAGVDLREEAQSAQTIYAVSYIVGGAALVAGVITMATAPSGDGGDGADEAAMTLAPWGGPGGGGLLLTGRF